MSTRNVAGKVPPQNVEAEKCVLGCLILDPDVIATVAASLPRAAFYVDAHRSIYDAILAVHRATRPVDLLTITNQLQEAGHLEAVGGSSAIAELTEFVPTAAHVEEYARIVRDAARKRALIHAGTEIAALGFSTDLDADAAHEEAERLVTAVRSSTTTLRIASIGDVFDQLYDDLATMIEGDVRSRLVYTGLGDLDRMLGGIEASDLIVLAARPSVGKTALALTIAQNVARSGRVVGLFSLEMSEQQLGRRIVSAETSIDGWKLRAGRLSDQEMDRLRQAMDRQHALPIRIIDSSGVSLADVRAAAREIQRRGGLDLLVIDYLQLMAGSAAYARSGNRVQEVSEIARGLKALARELDVPILLLSQLNRGVEGRDNKVPNLADLRESGEIEAAADAVLMLYRDDYYKPDDSDRPGEVEIHVKKHRNGPTGKVVVLFDKATTRFRSIEEHREPPEQMPLAA
jgi:replicative DNA helicase